MDKETEQTESIVPSGVEGKKKQQKLFALLVGFIVVLLILLIINWATQGSNNQNVEPVSKAAPVYDVSRQVEDKSYWMYKSEQVLKEQAKTQDNLQKKV